MLVNKLRKKLTSQFIRNVGWLGTAELINRILRLGTTVVVARILNSYDYGLVAVVLTTNEFSNVFTLRSGIGSKLVQANQEDIDILCDTAYWLNWLLCIGMFAIQCVAAFPIAWFYGDNYVILPICLVGLTYLMLPTFAIQSAMIYRENRLKIPAICNALQSFFSNILTVIFALLGFGMWAIVLPIILTMPIWIVINRRSHSWRIKKTFTLHRWKELAEFSFNILGVELLSKLRANLDYLLIGGFLGLNVLGVYYFAFNAGLGISLSLIQAFTWSLFPYLCESRGQGKFEEFKHRYFSSLKTIALIFIPLICLQASLAPFYVPIVFGQKWVTAIPILVLICLSALPRPFADSASILLQSIGKSRTDLYWNLLFTSIFALILVVSVQTGEILWVAFAVLVSHTVFMPGFAIWATKYVFRKSTMFMPTTK